MAHNCKSGPDTADGACDCGADGTASEEEALAAAEEAGLNRAALAALLQDAGGVLASAYAHIAAACRWGFRALAAPSDMAFLWSVASHPAQLQATCM